MGVGFWGWVLFIWICVALIGGVYDGESVATASRSDLNTVMDMHILKSAEFSMLGAEFKIPVPNGDFYTSLLNLATFNFSLFTGNLRIIRWFLIAVLGAPLIFIFMRDVMPTLINLVATLRRMSPI